eukprot:s944_g10.t1
MNGDRLYAPSLHINKELIEDDVFPKTMPRETSPDLHVPDPPDGVDEEREARPLLSSAFQAVVEKLVHVHIKELAEFSKGPKLEHRGSYSDRGTHSVPGINHVSFEDPSQLQPDESLQSLKSLRGPPPSPLAALAAQRSAMRSTRSMRSSKSMHSSVSRISSIGNSSMTSAFSGQRTPLREVKANEVLEKLQEKDHSSVEDAFANHIQDVIAQMKEEEMKSVAEKCSSADDLEGWTYLQKLRAWLQSSRFEVLVTSLLCVHVLWMALELQIFGSITGKRLGIYADSMVSEESWPAIEQIFWIGDMGFTAFFTFDVAFRILVLQRKFWRVCMNYVDVLVTCASLVEVAFVALVLPMEPTLFRLLRIGKLARALRMVTMTSVLSSLQLLIKCLSASLDMLFWTFCLLTFLQCVAGMVVSTLCREYITNPEEDQSKREQVYSYYGTFSRTFLTMFEILFANWSPPCRVLVDNVSEWFSIFFLVYRCIIGFAVLNVVNAVFVQQTMKTASSDEELAFKQKERDISMYTRKVRKLFQTMDDSCDGAINLEEFSKLVTSPKLKFWMSQLELEYHDLLSLFEFLDNGDGQITLTEFIEGSSRLKGHAKALDVFRLETKIEVLFEEILQMMHNGADASSYVQRVFASSNYKHIKANLDREQ